MRDLEGLYAVDKRSRAPSQLPVSIEFVATAQEAKEKMEQHAKQAKIQGLGRCVLRQHDMPVPEVERV